MTSFYFVVTTMTTVGYGDMSAGTIYEQFYIVILMMAGVFVFSMVTGSLASILASMDVENALWSESLDLLNRLQERYNLPKTLYNEVKKAIKHEMHEDSAGIHQFIESLPPLLRT